MTKNPTTVLGYARVSTGKQDEQMQLDALDTAGVLKRNRYIDHGVSGTKTSRPKFDELMDDIQTELDAGHSVSLVVYKLDRIGRSAGHVITLLTDLVSRGVHVRSVAEGIDTTTSTGRMMMQMLAIFAEMERAFISERTTAALASKRAQGIVGGRPRAADSATAKHAQTLRAAGTPVPEIASSLGLSIATVYRLTTSKK